MDRISLAELVSTDFFCGESVGVDKFVKYFGHYMDITPENLRIFIAKIVRHVDDFIDYIDDMGGLYLDNDAKVRELARHFGIAFCDRCFDPYDVMDEIRDNICYFNLERQAELVTYLFKNMTISRGIPDATLTHTGRFVAIEEVSNLYELLDIDHFARIFGNACNLNEEAFTKYYKRRWGYKKALVRAIIDEVSDLGDTMWDDFLAYLGIKIDGTYNDRDNARHKLNKMSVSRLSRAAVEIVNKKLDRALKERIEEEKKAIKKQLRKDMRSK